MWVLTVCFTVQVEGVGFVVVGEFSRGDLDPRGERFRVSEKLVQLEGRRLILGALPIPSEEDKHYNQFSM